MRLPVVALRNLTVLPKMLMHFDVSRKKSIAAVEQAMILEQKIFLTCQKDENTENPQEDDVFRTGTIGNIKQILKLPDHVVRVLIEGDQRAILRRMVAYQPYLEAEVEELPYCADVVNPLESEAMVRSLKENIEGYAARNPSFKDAGARQLASIQTLEELMDQTMIRIPMNVDQRQALLEQDSTYARFYMINSFLESEIHILDLKKEIQLRVKERVEQNQKEYVLREQLKVIREELGENESADLDQYEEKLRKLKAGAEVREKIEKEIRRLRMMPFGSREGTVSRTYIETLLELPWQKVSRENKNMKKAEQILNEDHYGMEKIKERILEYLAVRQLAGESGGSILCLVGPPGTGKTSIARSVARALDKKYVRVCLGGVRDEAEIRGHRRTYIGAMPGRIVTGLKQAGVANPLMLLDEIDKVSSDYKGDTSSALLEVLDGEQNQRFRDHYVELPVDLSEVLFICTANSTETIPRPLLDRMEIIEVTSYTANEKYHIATDHLLPKQMKKNGLMEGQLDVSRAVMEQIISGYTREAGVRNLERKLGEICRKAARRIYEGEKEQVKITAGNLEQYLGREKYSEDKAGQTDEVGIVRGLAWTSVGGVTLEVEVNLMPGKGEMKLTGQMGDVMKESAQTALSFVRSVSADYGIEKEFFSEHDIHIHIPAGAVPKDGPSAGITMASAMLSAVTNTPARADVAMTGEITLRGRVLPIGGLKEKLLAAKNAGVKTVCIPKKNEKDLEEISAEITKGLSIIPVEHMNEVLKAVLAKEAGDGN